ncbi:MAG: hypothetical protein ACTIAI_06155 [Pseudolactococcus laudensis]
MKNVMTAYYRLRKGWLIAFYSLIILAGMVGMVVDSGNWHTWEKQFDKYFSAKAYHEIRDYLGTEQVSHADVYEKYENANDYLNLIGFRGDIEGPEKPGEPRASIYYKLMPAKFETFREHQLAYYAPTDKHAYKYDFLSINQIWVSRPGESIEVSLNAVALIGAPLLVIVAVFSFMLMFDQWKKLPSFIRSRTGHAGLLLGAQAIYWAIIPFVLAGVMSVVTQLTRSLFIPEKFVTVPWAAILNYSADFLAQMILLAILAGFVHALVGNPIYKVITFICALCALGLSISVFHDLTGIGILNNFNQFSYFVYFMIGGVLILATVWLQSKYSLEQDSSYIRLPKLRLAFYLVIVFFAIFDFLVPLLALRGNNWNAMDSVIHVVVPVVFVVLFAKLVLNKDIRHLVLK